jgi:phenylalanyl-tRNA synthetase beta chain
MQFPESWLREFCDPPIGTVELAERLTMAGLEVEAMTRAAPPFRGVVVAKVLSVEPHPNADRLRVCAVDVGAGVPLSIV